MEIQWKGVTRVASNELKLGTHEKVVDLSLYVIKKNGVREQYSRMKVFKGINRAVEKRDVDMQRIEEVIDKIERKILREYSGEISSNDLGNMIMTSLLDLDEVAYVRFASVYKKFESLDSFIKEIENIRNERRG